MKTIKKISYSLLVAVALLFSVQINASASTISDYDSAYLKTRAESGQFTVHSGSMIIRNFPGYREPIQDTYGSGDTFYYDTLVDFVDTNHNYTHHYVSYVNGSGTTRYVYYGETRNGVYTRASSVVFTNVIF